MKALTIGQPYAELILRGEKLIENRTWPTNHRGPLLIHAGKSRSWLDPGDEARYPGMVFGAIVGQAMVTACLRVEHLPAGLREHAHAHGPWCWVLQGAYAVDPVPYRGAQGLFEVPDDIAAALRPRQEVVRS